MWLTKSGERFYHESIVETLVSRDYSESEHVVPESDHHIPLHTYIHKCEQFRYRTVARAF